jgi:predicted  nucleic acid-binding Zn-ribbon protein
MNKERREALMDVADTIEEAIDQIQDVIDDEQDAIDRLPESLQESERGAVMYEAVGDMEGLIDKLNVFLGELEATVARYSPKKKSK